MELKVCGITDSNALKTLDAFGVEYAGLWFNIPYGKYSLKRHEFVELTHTKTRKLRKIGVTTDNNEYSITRFIEHANIHALQLHGFQTPGFVSSLKQRIKCDIKIAKVLHIENGVCLEKKYIDLYKDAGVDFFILDTFVSSTQIGSTGVRFSLDAIEPLLSKTVPENTFLAGGFDAKSIIDLHKYKQLRGVDVDSAAREGGIISEFAVQKLVASAKVRKRSLINA